MTDLPSALEITPGKTSVFRMENPKGVRVPASPHPKSVTLGFPCGKCRFVKLGNLAARDCGQILWVARPESSKGVAEWTPFEDSGRATHPKRTLLPSCALPRLRLVLTGAGRYTAPVIS